MSFAGLDMWSMMAKLMKSAPGGETEKFEIAAEEYLKKGAVSMKLYCELAEMFKDSNAYVNVFADPVLDAAVTETRSAAEKMEEARDHMNRMKDVLERLEKCRM